MSVALLIPLRSGRLGNETPDPPRLQQSSLKLGEQLNSFFWLGYLDGHGRLYGSWNRSKAEHNHPYIVAEGHSGADVFQGLASVPTVRLVGRAITQKASTFPELQTTSCKAAASCDPLLGAHSTFYVPIHISFLICVQLYEKKEDAYCDFIISGRLVMWLT